MIDGTLDAQGTSGNEVVFRGTDPTAGNHGGMVHLRSGSGGSVLKHVQFDNMGDTNAPIDGSLVISDNISIDNLTITDSESAGIYIDNNATPTIGTVSVSTSGTGINILSGNAVFDNASFTSNATGVTISGGSPQISNSLIDGNTSNGLLINGGTPTLTGNTISNNSDGLEVSGYYAPVVTGNTFSGSTRDVLLPLSQVDKIDFSTNTGLTLLHLNGLNVTANTTVSSSYVYELTSDITVDAGVTLTLQPGVQIEFPWVFYDILIDGTLDSQGTSGNEVVFRGERPHSG